MNSDILLFFNTHAAALPLYEAVEKRICDNVDGVKVKTGKSRISFYNRHMFACVSFLAAKRKKEMPPVYITLTLGLDRPLENPAPAVAVEPYPGRWTNHIVISDTSQVNKRLIKRIKQAADFAAAK